MSFGWVSNMAKWVRSVVDRGIVTAVNRLGYKATSHRGKAMIQLRTVKKRIHEHYSHLEY